MSGNGLDIGCERRELCDRRSSATVTVEPAAGGEARTLEADVVLVAIGRRPTLIAKWRAYMRFTLGWKDWRFVFGQNPS